MRGLTTRKRWVLAAVIAFGVLGRIGWAVHLHDQHRSVTRRPDTPSYTEPARALVRDFEFDRGPESDLPEFRRSPGYPAYIALIYSFTGESDLAVLVGQGLLGAATMLLVFALVRAFGASYRVGLVAVVLVVFEPLQFAASGTLLTESISALCLTAAAYCGVRMVQTDFHARWAVAFGGSLALATLVRPSMYYAPLLVALIIVAFSLVRRPLRRSALVAGAIMLAPVALVYGGWQLRNHERVGSWRFSGIEGANMYLYTAAGAISEEDGTSLGSVQARLEEKLNADLDLRGVPRERREAKYLDRAYSRGVELVLEHPTGFVVMTAKGLAREIGGIGDETTFPYLRLEPSAPVRALAWLALALFYALMAIGVVSAGRHRWGSRLAHAIPLALVAYVLLVSAPSGGGASSRFRTPVMPLLAVYAALGVGAMRSWRSRRDAPVPAENGLPG